MRFLDNRIHLTVGERLIASPIAPISRELSPTDRSSPPVRRINADHVAGDIAVLDDGGYVAYAAGHATRIDVHRGRIFCFGPAPASGGAGGAMGRGVGLPHSRTV